MPRGRNASLVESKIQMILFGKPFTGKSTLASQFAYFKNENGKPFRVLYIDPESGSIDDYLESMQNNGIDLKNIYIVYTQSLQEVRDYIQLVKNNEDLPELDDDGNPTGEIVRDADGEPFRADAIVVDGTSLLNLTTKSALLSFSKIRNTAKADAEQLTGCARLAKIDGAGLELKDYQTINFRGQDLILDLAACGKHWIATARETYERETIKDKNGNTTSVSTGELIPEGFKGLDYNAKTVVRMFRKKDEPQTVYGEILKDRTGCHNSGDMVEDISLMDWQSVIDKSKGREKFVIKNDLAHSADVERQHYEKSLEMFTDIPKTADEPKPKSTATSSAPAAAETKPDETTTLKDEIATIMRGFSPPLKKQASNALAEKGLPSTPKALKAETDAATIRAAYEIVKSIA